MAKVYVMDDGVHRKIGRSTNTENRRRALSSQIKRSVNVVYAVDCDDAGAVERAAHAKLAAFSLGNEWFAVTIENAIEAVEYGTQNPLASAGATASELVAASQKRIKDAGGGRFPNIMLQPDEFARWRAIEDRIGGPERGRSKRALMHCIEMAEIMADADSDPVLTNAELLAMIEARMR